jgi:hypothetical protein
MPVAPGAGHIDHDLSKPGALVVLVLVVEPGGHRLDVDLGCPPLPGRLLYLQLGRLRCGLAGCLLFGLTGRLLGRCGERLTPPAAGHYGGTNGRPSPAGRPPTAFQ